MLSSLIGGYMKDLTEMLKGVLEGVVLQKIQEAKPMAMKLLGI